MELYKTKLASGVISAILAYILWGVSSLYWHLLADVPGPELLAYRILMSLVVLVLVLALARKLTETLRSATAPKNLLIYSLSGLSVAVNWGAFMWGSIHGHVVETGLGYLIAPLINVAFGTVLLNERLTKARVLAVLIMAGAIALLIIRSTELDIWVYAAIALSFGFYSLLRKLGPLGAIPGLAVETSILAVIVVVISALGTVPLSYPVIAPADSAALLLVCGLVSVIPLWLFSVANRAVPLSTLGFFQYLLPTTQFLLAVTFYHQPASTNTMVSLGLIWIALGIVLIEAARTHSRPVPTPNHAIPISGSLDRGR